MVAPHGNNSQFITGTETITYFATDDDDTGVEVDNSRRGEWSKAAAKNFGSIVLAGDAAVWRLDEADLDEVVPIKGGRIDQANGAKWRIEAIRYSHMSGVYLCACNRDTD